MEGSLPKRRNLGVGRWPPVGERSRAEPVVSVSHRNNDCEILHASPKGKARKMDISRLSLGAKIVLGASIAFLIVSIFNWQEVEFAGIASAGVSMWHGWGVIAGLLAIALIVWEGTRLVNMRLEIGISPTMVTTGLAILLVLFTFLKFVVDNEFRTFWAWLGLILAIVIVAAAVMGMQAAGESLGDMKASMTAAASGAAAAARSTRDSGEKAPAAEAPAPPAPAAPAPPPAPSGGETASGDTPDETRPAS